MDILEVLNTKREQFICPNCRSVVQVKGVPDAIVGDLQDLYCPVCSQMWWFSSWRQSKPWWLTIAAPIVPVTLPTTYQWYVEKVLEKGPEPIPPTQLINRPPPGGGWQGVTQQAAVDYKKFALYGFLILSGLIVINQITKKIF